MNNQLSFNEMMNAALGFQRQLWDSWTGAAGVRSPSNSWNEEVERSFGMSEELVNHCLKLQEDCMKAMMKCIEPGETAPEAFSQYFTQLEQGLDELLSVQKSGFEMWFKLIRQCTPIPSSGNMFGKNPNELFEAWQKTSEEAMQRQARFFFSLFPAQPVQQGGEKKPSNGKPKPVRAA